MALMEYGAQLLHNPPKIEPEPSAELTDEAMISAAFARWPDLLRYAETARIETVYDAQRDEWRACVTVTVWERGEG